MIDENGKIGGKINLIDLLIVVVVLAAIAFTVCRSIAFNKNNDTDKPETDPVIIEFTCAEVDDFTIERLEAGAPVLNGDTNKNLGTAVDFTTADSTFTAYSVGDSGMVVVDIPETKSVVVTVESAGELEDNGLVVDGVRYGIGYSMVIYVGRCKLWATISGIEPA